MKGTFRSVVASACALALLGATGATAAPPPPQTVVAKVGEQRISRAQVVRWSLSAADVEPTETLAMYARCVRSPSPPASCAPIVRTTERYMAGELISMRQLLAEARRLGIRPDRVRLPSRMRDEARSLRLPRADRKLWARAVGVSLELERRAYAALGPITDAELERAWRAEMEPSWFLPRTLRAEVVELRTRADGDAALAAARAGEPLASVGARLSSAKGRLRGAPELFEDTFEEDPESRPRLIRALLKAVPGEWVGPLAIADRFYVARVIETVAERRRIPLEEVRERVFGEVDWRRRGRAADAAERRVRARGRQRTTCVRGAALRSFCGRFVAAIR